MFDLMYKATDKAAWDAYVASLPMDLVGEIVVDEIGPIVITPPVIDESGEIVEDGVVDLSHHVNLRLLSDDFVVAAALSEGGPGVEWVNPDWVATPARIWAGGMTYWRPANVEESV